MMKKVLVCLVLMLSMLFAFTAAFADEMPDVCPYCGSTDLAWVPINYDGNDCHSLVCRSCSVQIGELEVCTPVEGSATCCTPEICEVCDSYMYLSGSIDPDKHDMSEVESTWYFREFDENNVAQYDALARRWCNNCSNNYQEVRVRATWEVTTEPTCTEEGIRTYIAVFEEDWAGTLTNDQLSHVPQLGHSTEVDKAVAPTCEEDGLTEGKHCSVCGKVIMEQEVIPALGHSYDAHVVEPTCTEDGYTMNCCAHCGDTYISDFNPATLHHFGLWSPNGDSTHSAACRRCAYIGTSPCTTFEVTLADGETVLTVCLVCGEAGDAVFEVIENAQLVSAGDAMLPIGEAIIRGMEAPFDDVPYAFTAAYEYSGEAIPFGTTVSVSLPLDAEQFASFELVRVDVTTATETSERTEVRTAVPFTFEDGVLTFEADDAGLYLIVAE